MFYNIFVAGALDNKDMFNKVIFSRQSQKTHRTVLCTALSTLYARVNFHLLSVPVLSHAGPPVRFSHMLDLDEVLYSFLMHFFISASVSYPERLGLTEG